MLCIHQKICLALGLLFIGVMQANSLWAAEFANQKEHRLAYKVQQKMDEGAYQECRQLLKPYFAAHDRPSPTLFVLLGQVQTELEQDQEALKTYERAAKLYPDNVLILRNYAATCLQSGRLTQAARLLERAHAHNGSSELLYQAGGAWFEAEEYSRAAQATQRLLQGTQKPKTEWVELLVYSLVRLQKWDRAEARLQDLIDRRPNTCKLWELLASVRSRQDNILGAASALEVAYAIDHPGKKKWRDLASMYAAADVPLMAVKAMRNSLADNPGPEECWRMGRLWVQAMRIDQGIEWMDRALAQTEKPKWYLDKAHVLYSHGRYSQCREAAIRAAELESKLRGEAWMLAGYAAWQEQDWQGAQEAFARAKEVKETASRAASCLQTMEQILNSEQEIRLAGNSLSLEQKDPAGKGPKQISGPQLLEKPRM
ncbi:MAG: tetratricopeptide repeat protein [Desulfovermiculus sp.]